MTRPKHTGQRRSSSSSSISSSENNLCQNIEEPLRRTSQSSLSKRLTKQKLLYPNVPKRTQRCSSNNQHHTIQTESQIIILPPEIEPHGHKTHPSYVPTSNQNACNQHALNLLTKYTSPKRLFSNYVQDRSFSSVESYTTSTSKNESNYRSKPKRTCSPLNDKNQLNNRAKRTKPSFRGNGDDDNDDDDMEVSEFLDHRYNKKSLSQNCNATNSFPLRIDNEQKKPTVRKPTARKLSTNQMKPIVSQTVRIENSMDTIPKESDQLLIIESDVDTEGEDIDAPPNPSVISNHSSLLHTQATDNVKPLTSPSIISSPMRIPLDIHTDSLNSSIDKNLSSTPIKHSKINCSPTCTLSKNMNENSIGDFSPSSKQVRRRHSSESENSVSFATPCSSFSRTTANHATSISQIVVKKNDSGTQTILPSYMNMINQLISQINLTTNENGKKIDYNPKEIATKLFYQCKSFSSTNQYSTRSSFIKKQFLHIGRYEIEVLHPIDSNKISTIYACDICLKPFYGSSIGFQRHSAKCLYTQPPGKLVFNENNLAIFHIGQTKLNIEQRIYLKSLCHIARLFVDSNKIIDDTKIDRFNYYILCRRDPILSHCQPSLYRLIGYFCKEVNQNAQQSMHNLSCLFVLPPFAQHQEYNQLLIAFSYFLIRSNAPATLIYSSPARPIDIMSLSALRTYWRDTILTSIFHQHRPIVQTIALDTLARQTFIHPRDILSCLYSNGLIVSHPTDKTSIYLIKNAHRSIGSLNLHIRNQQLFTNTNLNDEDDNTKVTVDKNNDDKIHDSGIEEIVLD